MKTKVLVIVGPTASGKSALAVELARELDGEIISADSRQVYRGLDLGSGKITKREMKSVPHHLLDVAKLSNRPWGSIGRFTVADYQKLAQEKIEEINKRGKLAIICGGTGLYIDAVLGRVTIPQVPPDLKLRQKLEKKSAAELFTILQKLDPTRADKIDRHNPRRLVRAIEIAKSEAARSFGLTFPDEGRVKTKGLAAQPYDMLWLGLNPGPEKLKENIKKRLAKRIKQGLIEEVRDLHQKKKISWKRLEELGLEYRYLSRFLRKERQNFESRRSPRREGEARKILPFLKQLEAEIWHYAKRQMTWFKKNSAIQWLAPSPPAGGSRLTKMKQRIKAWRLGPKRGSTDTRR